MNCNYTYTDKEQITDLLMSEKYLTACYNGYLLEAATPEVIGCLKELLNNTHKMADYDEAIMEIVMDGAQPFLAGKATAEKVARMVQSRVRLYVNEQR